MTSGTLGINGTVEGSRLSKGAGGVFAGTDRTEFGT